MPSSNSAHGATPTATEAVIASTTAGLEPAASATAGLAPAVASTNAASARAPFIASADAMNTKSTKRTVTENGAPCHSDTGDATVDLFFKAVRGLPSADLSSLFNSCVAEAGGSPDRIADLVVLAFHTRATRGMGKGERELFYSLLLLLAGEYGNEVVLATLPLVSHYGYFKDLLAILALQPPAPVAERCVSLFVEALRADEAELKAAEEQKRTPKLSLAGKWAPREGGKSDRACKSAKALAKALYGGANPQGAQRRYRKLIASLNAALSTTEVLMASNRWAEIQFGSVASLCLARCRKAFLNEALKGGRLTPEEEATGNRLPNDPGRVAARVALKAAIASKGGVQGKALMPHQIASKFMCGYGMCGYRGTSSSEEELLHAQWVSMREGTLEAMAAAAAERAAAVSAAAAAQAAAEGATDGVASLSPLGAALPSRRVDLGKLVPLVDVSGSMSGTPMEVAIALGILVSECTLPAFRHRVLTFESQPSWVDLSECASIGDKVRKVQSAEWGGSTDFAAACERILDAAQRAKLGPDQIPDLIVFSDMQFDQAGDFGGCHWGFPHGGHWGRSPSPSRSRSWETHLERLQRRFAEVGKAVCGEPYAAPRIIFWNLRGDARGVPATADTPNTQMLSGFSPALLKLVLSGADIVAEEEEVVQPDGTTKVVRSGPTPRQTLRAALDDAAFDAVRLKLSELTEGPLKDYRFVKEEENDREAAEVAKVGEMKAEAQAMGGEDFEMVGIA